MQLNKPVVGMAATPDGNGYWLVASDGGVFAYGDAGFYGSTGCITLNKPIIGMIPTLDGGGYWLIASDGGVFAFGDATFYGSAGGDNLAYPVTAAARASSAAATGWSTPTVRSSTTATPRYEGQPPFAPGGYRITGMAPTQSSQRLLVGQRQRQRGRLRRRRALRLHDRHDPERARSSGWPPTATATGYWLQGADGGIFTFGDAEFYGSMGGHPLNAPMVGIAAT